MMLQTIWPCLLQLLQRSTSPIHQQPHNELIYRIPIYPTVQLVTIIWRIIFTQVARYSTRPPISYLHSSSDPTQEESQDRTISYTNWSATTDEENLFMTRTWVPLQIYQRQPLQASTQPLLITKSFRFRCNYILCIYYHTSHIEWQSCWTQGQPIRYWFAVLGTNW